MLAPTKQQPTPTHSNPKIQTSPTHRVNGQGARIRGVDTLEPNVAQRDLGCRAGAGAEGWQGEWQAEGRALRISSSAITAADTLLLM